MSVQALGWAFDVEGISPTDKLVLLSLANHAHKKTAVCFPSKKLVAEETGLSESAIQKSIKRLVDHGLIISKPQYRNDGSRTVNEYTLQTTRENPPPVRDDPPIEEPSYNLPSSTEEGGGAPDDVPVDDRLDEENALEKEVFAVGRRVLGGKCGGVVTNLRRAIDNDAETLDLLRFAATKFDPMEWIAGCIRNNGPPADIDFAKIRELAASL